MGLVPENYLALLEADLSLVTKPIDDEEEDDEEWEEEEEEEDEENRGGDERDTKQEHEDEDEDTEEERDVEGVEKVGKVEREIIPEEEAVVTPRPSTSIIEISDLVEPVISEEESPALVAAVIA